MSTWEQIVRLVGEDSACQIARLYGGQRISFRRADLGLPADVSRRLREHYGAEAVYIPLARQQQADYLRRSGVLVRPIDIAQALGVSVRTVQRWRRQAAHRHR